MSTDTVLPDDEACRTALGRAAVYACLARGFVAAAAMPAWPDADGEGSDPLALHVRALRDAAEASDPAELRRAYMRIFDPRNPPYPLEAEHRAEHFRQRTDLLADVMGFYKAFAVEPDHERPDHVACELDFIHVVSLKEARALAAGRTEQADICADARRAFLADHLLTWYEAVVAMVRKRARPADRFYRALADLLDTLMLQEKESQP